MKMKMKGQIESIYPIKEHKIKRKTAKKAQKKAKKAEQASSSEKENYLDRKEREKRKRKLTNAVSKYERLISDTEEEVTVVVDESPEVITEKGVAPTITPEVS